MSFIVFKLWYKWSYLVLYPQPDFHKRWKYMTTCVPTVLYAIIIWHKIMWQKMIFLLIIFPMWGNLSCFNIPECSMPLCIKCIENHFFRVTYKTSLISACKVYYKSCTKIHKATVINYILFVKLFISKFLVYYMTQSLYCLALTGAFTLSLSIFILCL